MKRHIMWLAAVVLLAGLGGGAGRAAAADVVVGAGTPASCDEAAFDAALATAQADNRGSITFDCGPAAHTIEIFSSATITKEVAIDGGDRIRLLAQGGSPLFVKPRFFEIAGGGWLTLSNIILEGARGPAGDGWGSQGGSIVVWGNGQLDVQGATILNSASTAWGGAIANEGGIVRVQDSTISGAAKWGGAYNGANGYDIFINATVTDSAGQDGGGGLRFWNTLRTEISGSTIGGNSTSGAGGGIEAVGSNVTIRGSYVEGNAAAQWGGGIKNSNNPGKTGTMLIENSRIAGNVSALNGGGIDSNGELVLRDTLVSGNTATWGGGILSWGGQLALDGATLSQNSADRGGGAYVHGGGATIDASQITDNEATDGGGLYLTEIDGSSAVNWAIISNSDVTGNQATANAGGILAERAYAAISRTEIANNDAVAVYLWKTASGGSYVVVTQSSIHDNTGGGFYNGELSTLTIGNSTISQNGDWGVWAGLDSVQTLLGFSTVRGNTLGQIKRTGGQLVLEGTAIDRGATAAANCLTAPGLPSAQGSGSIASDGSCGPTVAVSSDLDLGPLEANGGATPSHMPQPGSALIDAVDCGTYSIDQRGATRPQGASCDMGAVEVGAVGHRAYVPMILR